MALVGRNLRGIADRPALEPLRSEVSLMRLYMTLGAKVGTPPERQIPFNQIVFRVSSPIIRMELSAHASIWNARNADLASREINASFSVAQSFETSSEISRWDKRILRLGFLTAAGDSRKLLASYLLKADRFPRDRELWRDPAPRWLQFTEESNHFGGIWSTLQGEMAHGFVSAVTFAELDTFWREAKRHLLSALGEGAVQSADLVPLVVCDHADWIRCLANSLNRTLQDKRSNTFLARLSQADFLETNRISATEAIRFIADQGRLLDFCRFVTDVLHPQKTSFETESLYPQSLYELANALLTWHETLLRTANNADAPGAFLA